MTRQTDTYAFFEDAEIGGPSTFHIHKDGRPAEVAATASDYATARLIAQALTINAATGLTPRQLAEQRAELLEIADAAVRALASDICNLVPDEDLQRWQAAIAKARGGSDA